MIIRASNRLGLGFGIQRHFRPSLFTNNFKAAAFSSGVNNAASTSTSCWSQSPGFLGQYIPRDNGAIKIVLLDPRKDKAAWEEYKTKLCARFQQYGFEADVTALDNVGDASSASPKPTAPQTVLLALATCLESDEMIGGLRIEGPFDAPEELMALRSCKDMPHVQTVRERMRQLLNGSNAKLMEGRGNWTNRRGISHSLCRALVHLMWCTNGTHLVGISSEHTSELYGRIGYGQSWWFDDDRNIDMPLFPYPDERYRSAHIMLTPDHLGLMDPSTKHMVRYEQKVLAQAKERYRKLQLQQQHCDEKPKGNAVDLEAWHPEILLDDDPRLGELVNDPSIQVIDHLPSQYQELARDRLPRVTDEALLREPPHWIYLPWRNAVVRMLGPKGYHLLRTDRNRWKMTEEETSYLQNKSVGVIGMSVGHTCAVTIAQEGLCGHMKLADFDHLELTNMNRIPASILELGQNKTLMTARRIAELDPYLPMEVFPEGASEENMGEFLDQVDCIVEECDSIDIKVLTRFEAAKRRIPVIMEASDHGTMDVERFDVDPNRPPFHGLAGGWDSIAPQDLKGMSADDKASCILDLLELEKISPPLAATFAEMGQTVSSWSQLARDVTLGGALVATAVHKLFTDPDNLPSGRSRTYLKDALLNLVDPLEEEKTNKNVPMIQIQPQSNRRPPLPDNDLEALYVGAGCAPSGANRQPWNFSHDDNYFHVAAYAEDSPTGMDFNYRATAVACGAALANAAALAAKRFGVVGDPIVWNGDFDQIEGRLAAGESVHVGSICLTSDGETRNERIGNVHHQSWAELGDSVNNRVTNRQKGPSIPLCEDQVMALTNAVDPYGYLYYMPVDHPDYGTVLDVWGQAERMRMLDPKLHSELFEEIVWPQRGDNMERGIDICTLELTEKQQKMMRLLERADSMELLRQWDLGERLGEEARKNLKACAGMVSVGVEGGGRFEDHVRGGVALERMWLKATSMGLALQPWCPIFGYASSKESLSRLIGPERANILYPPAQQALQLIGFEGLTDNFVLSLRIHTGPPSSAISQRRPILIQEMNASELEVQA